MGSAPHSPPDGGALSTGGFLSFQLLGPPSFVYFRGSRLSRPGGQERRGREGGPHPQAPPGRLAPGPAWSCVAGTVTSPPPQAGFQGAPRVGGTLPGVCPGTTGKALQWRVGLTRGTPGPSSQ